MNSFSLGNDPFQNSFDLKIGRTLLSVSDKTGLAQLAKELARFGSELIATGGTAKLLEEEKIGFRAIEDFTGNPEAFDGRMKTLSFRLEGAILFDRENADHVEQAEMLGVPPIDCVVCNLYPFEATLEKLLREKSDLGETALKTLIEKIDVGGPTMIRAAAKNYRNVLVIVDPKDYETVIQDLHLREGAVSLALREELMLKAFERMAAYEHAISQSLGSMIRARRNDFPKSLVEEHSRIFSHGFLPHGKILPLRYGENPHQKAVFVESLMPENLDWFGLSDRGIPLSYNNVLDGQSAFETARDAYRVAQEMEFGRNGDAQAQSPHVVCIVKHNNPCGLAVAESTLAALEAAWSGDPVSSFGGVLALSHEVDLKFVNALDGRFVEMILAPDFTADALEKLSTSKKKVRLVRTKGWDPESLEKATPLLQITRVEGGYLLQEKDHLIDSEFQAVTKKPWFSEFGLTRFGIVAGKAVKSNSIVLVREKAGVWQMIGMGSGQPNRIDALQRLALPKALEVLKALGEKPSDVISGAILVSDAFFPFADIISAAKEAGIKFIVQPGGSIRDAEVIAACDAAGMAMIFTGKRHFRH